MKNKKKFYLFLSQLFIVRVDLSLLKTDDSELLLIASDTVLNRLPDIQKSYFTSIKSSNFTDVDLENNIRDLMEKHDIDSSNLRIVTNDEFALGAAAKLREKFNLKGAKFSSIEPFINKLVMKKKVMAAGIRVPKYLPFDPVQYQQDKDAYVARIFDTLGVHIFAKPIDSVGSQDTCEIKTEAELYAWCESHPTATNFELDEFLDGELYHVDSIVKDGSILSVEPCLYAYPNALFLSDKKPFGSRTLAHTEEEYLRLIEFNQNVLEALLPLPDGATHHEIFRKNNGELVFLEIAARPTGGFAPDMHLQHGGYNFEENHFLAQMERPIKPAIPTDERTTYAAWLWYPRAEGKVDSVNQCLSINSNYNLMHQVKAGDCLTKPNTLRDTTATLFMHSKNYAQLAQDFERMKYFHPITVYPVISSSLAVPDDNQHEAYSRFSKT